MCGYMHMAHHDCRAWISILCWFWINPYLLKKYLAVSLCALGQQAITIIWFLNFLISFFTLKIWFSSFSKVNFTFIFFSSSVFFHKSQYNKNHKILVLKFNGYSIDEINIKCLILIGKKKKNTEKSVQLLVLISSLIGIVELSLRKIIWEIITWIINQWVSKYVPFVKVYTKVTGVEPWTMVTG